MKKLLAMLLSLVMVLSMLTVAVFAEPGDQDSQEEVDEPGDEITVTDEENKEDENPKTGIALSVLPVIVSGAAVAFSKKH